jgi:hypothetical protein
VRRLQLDNGFETRLEHIEASQVLKSLVLVLTVSMVEDLAGFGSPVYACAGRGGLASSAFCERACSVLRRLDNMAAVYTRYCQMHSPPAGVIVSVSSNHGAPWLAQDMDDSACNVAQTVPRIIAGCKNTAMFAHCYAQKASKLPSYSQFEMPVLFAGLWHIRRLTCRKQGLQDSPKSAV